MKPTSLYERSTLALSRRALAHLRDYRLLKINGASLDEPTLLRLGQHLADTAEKFIAALPAPAPRSAAPSGDPPPRERVSPAAR